MYSNFAGNWDFALPEEITLHIFSFLSIKEIVKIFLVCKTFYDIASANKGVLFREFPFNELMIKEFRKFQNFLGVAKNFPCEFIRIVIFPQIVSLEKNFSNQQKKYKELFPKLEGVDLIACSKVIDKQSIKIFLWSKQFETPSFTSN